jgi:hypothetical protein
LDVIMATQVLPSRMDSEVLIELLKGPHAGKEAYGKLLMARASITAASSTSRTDDGASSGAKILCVSVSVSVSGSVCVCVWQTGGAGVFQIG